MKENNKYWLEELFDSPAGIYASLQACEELQSTGKAHVEALTAELNDRLVAPYRVHHSPGNLFQPSVVFLRGSDSTSEVLLFNYMIATSEKGILLCYSVIPGVINTYSRSHGEPFSLFLRHVFSQPCIAERLYPALRRVPR